MTTQTQTQPETKQTYTPAQIKSGYYQRMIKARQALIKNPTDKQLNQAYTAAKNNYFVIMEGYEKLT